MHLPLPRQAPGAGPPAGATGLAVDGGQLDPNPAIPAIEASAPSQVSPPVVTVTESSAPAVPEPPGKGVGGVAIALPIVVGVALILALLYFYYKHKRANFLARQPELPVSSAQARQQTGAEATREQRAQRREMREQRRLAALRRTESGRSVATLPTYKPEPGDDEELILLKRMESGSEGSHTSHAPSYDDTPRPEHPPTWSEIHGYSTAGHVSNPSESASPTSPASGRLRAPWRSAPPSAAGHAHSALSHHSAPVHIGNPYAPGEPKRAGSPASSTWSTSTSSDEDAADGEARMARARRVVGESTGKLLGSSSLRKHLRRDNVRRGESFRLSPANSRMSSIRSVFTARTHQSALGHGRPGSSADRLLPRAREEEEEELDDGDETERPRSRGSVRDSIRATVGRISPVPRVSSEAGHAHAERARKKLQRKSTY